MPLSRSSSLSSISSMPMCAEDATDIPIMKTKRTRKRFSAEQLFILEQAYRTCSHPSRDERGIIAKSTDLDVKSVTIWFQNKRQTERKVALSNPLKTSGPFTLSAVSSTSPSCSQTKSGSSTHSYPLLSHSSHTSSSQSSSKSPAQSRTSNSYLSLDHVASRSEISIREPRTPRKSKRGASPHGHYNLNSAVWENMPSSPIHPETVSRSASSITPDSPTAREYLDFAAMRRLRGRRTRVKRTLEWACAAARLNAEREEDEGDKKQAQAPSTSLRVLNWDQLPLAPSQSFDTESISTCIDDEKTECADTEVESVEDSQEAITPHNSQTSVLDVQPCDIAEAKLPDSEQPPKLNNLRNVNDAIDTVGKDKDLMDIAWALCGLGAQRS